MNSLSLRLTGPTVVEVLLQANCGFADRLRLVTPSDWSRPTPCSEWDVRALVNHVVGANVRYQMLLAGAPLSEVEATRGTDHLGEHPVAAFCATAAVAADSFRAPGVLDRTFRHAAGERTGRELLLMRIVDVAVHGWDLARALGGDERIDAGVVAVALTATAAGDDELDDTPAQDRLLCRLGRQPTKENDDDRA
jgi:uncharacterized protein (TIGR03086 family)